MFYHIEGEVTDTAPYLAVIDCSGVGYAVSTSVNTLSKLKKGERAKLYTYLHVREDCFDLYGFATLNEKRLFEMLISVSGVGPKASISILSSGTPERIAMAIIQADELVFTAAPGIGKKTAQRIILELKDKVSKETEDIIFPSDKTTAVLRGGKLNDASQALAVLGYNPAEIANALSGFEEDGHSLEEMIKEALRKMIK
ncbi:MAG: Holliday junction branch migration protein RuvA [Oscillospiraceae bacterium]|nr:Holliday junction branch migration protein RuvA [Oscillospiraceae bacterium]